MSRSPLILGLLAGMACGIALGTSAPVGANPVQQVHYDVHARCANFAGQLEEELQHFWAREQLFGDVQVQFDLDNGRIDDVQTQGRFSRLNSAVRSAVQRLSCSPQATEGRQVYRFHVSVIDPDRTSRAEAFARAPARSVAVAEIKP